mgnify:CR=1 FL=1
MVVIVTLLGLDVLLSVLKARSPTLERWIDGLPTIIVRDGRPIEEALARTRIDTHDILSAARTRQGLARMDQIQWAVLEANGDISIIPRPQEKDPIER